MKKALLLISLAMLAACGGGGGGGGSLPSTPVAKSTPPSNSAGGPTATPSSAPSGAPTTMPTNVPTMRPTNAPTMTPTNVPTMTPTTVPTNVPTMTPTMVPTASPTASPSSAAVAFTANIPINESQNYSNDPLVFGVRLLSVNGAAANAVTTQVTSCRTTSCRVSIQAPVGSDAFSITYAIGANGSATSGLEALAYRGNFTVPVAANAANSAAVTLLGVPAYYELDALGNAPWNSSMPLLLQGVDDSNVCTPAQVINGCSVAAFIRGTFAMPITLTDTDTSGQTALSVNRGAPARVVTVLHSTDTVSLIINAGANVQQAYVTPSAAFSAAEFGPAYASITQEPWTTQDPDGLGFTCANGACQTTGPTSVIIQ